MKESLDDGKRFAALRKLSFVKSGEPHFVLFVKNSNYTIFVWRGKVYWDDIESGESLELEDVFDKLSDEAKEEIIFNLDLFK